MNNKNKKTKTILYIIVVILIISFIYILLNTEINTIIKSEILKEENQNTYDDELNEDPDQANTIVAEKSEDEVFEEEVMLRHNNVENILLIGIDSPNVEKVKEKEDNNKNNATGFRTDTIMIANIDKYNNSVNIISIPRDSRVLINGKYDKINHAHSYGGIKKLQEVIEENFGISVDKYARIDYKAVKEITNDIGGVDVVIEEDMKYEDPTPELGVSIDFKPGTYNLKGDDAIRFLRYRSSEGDIYRVKNQQYFLEQFINKIYSIGTIKAGKIIIDNSIKYVDTNLTLGEMLGLLNFGSKLNINNIEFHTLSGYGKYINKISYYILEDIDELKDIVYN